MLLGLLSVAYSKKGIYARSAHTTAYEASGSSGTARQEGVAVSLV